MAEVIIRVSDVNEQKVVCSPSVQEMMMIVENGAATEAHTNALMAVKMLSLVYKVVNDAERKGYQMDANQVTLAFMQQFEKFIADQNQSTLIL